MTIQPALMLIADISGYTRFMKVNRVNLAHAQEVIAELLGAVIDSAKSRWKLAKLEGDAAFFYATEDECRLFSSKEPVDLAHEAARIRAAFLARQRDLVEHGHCTCEGCDQAPQLKLKFVAHRGEVAFQKVRGNRELAGVDVILVHRMLKNSVPLSEYVLVSEAATEHVRAPLHPKLERLDEEFEGLGRVRTHYLDMALIANDVPVPEVDRGRLFRLTAFRMFLGILAIFRFWRRPQGYRHLDGSVGGLLPAPALVPADAGIAAVDQRLAG